MQEVMELCSAGANWAVSNERIVVQPDAAHLLVTNRSLPIVDMKADDVRVSGGGERAVLTSTVWTRFRHVYTGMERASERRQAWWLEKESGRWKVVRVVWEAL